MRRAINSRRLIGKSVALFLAFEWLVMVIPPPLEKASAFALLGLRRERFPLSTVSPADIALDVGNLDAMFASHEISAAKAADEFRVLVLGDSTIWGLGLTPQEVLPGRLNALHLACGIKHLRFYNLSFPRSSASKDLMILDRAMAYQPDAIVWLLTWYTLMPKTRVDHWIVSQNPDDFMRLAVRFDFLPRDYLAPGWAETVFNRNRSLFRTLRFQLYAAMQLATGQDQIAGPPQVLVKQLTNDQTFEGLRPPTLRRNQVSLDQVAAFQELAAGVPVLMVNSPILILEGLPNSDLRYNSYYPRWVYDQYRFYLADAASANGWAYTDLWNLFPEEDFADTPLHLVPAAHRALASYLAPDVVKMCPEG
jgi:hypothetical protein